MTIDELLERQFMAVLMQTLEYQEALSEFARMYDNGEEELKKLSRKYKVFS